MFADNSGNNTDSILYKLYIPLSLKCVQIKASQSLHTFATSVVASCLSDNYIVCSGWCINNVCLILIITDLSLSKFTKPLLLLFTLFFVLFCLLQFLHLLYCFVLIELTTLSCLCIDSSINLSLIHI